MKVNKGAFALLGAAALLASGVGTASAASSPMANGQGTLDGGARHFSFSARQLDPGGAAQGQATLTNSSFTGENGKSPYKLQIDITCMKTFGNTVYFGGWTKRTNDPNLVDAVFFAVQDNAEPGKGVDQISRAYFWDDDPNTAGDPMACRDNAINDFPMEPIEAGNIQVRSGS